LVVFGSNSKLSESYCRYELATNALFTPTPLNLISICKNDKVNYGLYSDTHEILNSLNLSVETSESDQKDYSNIGNLLQELESGIFSLGSSEF
jgi:hypothetical protein